MNRAARLCLPILMILAPACRPRAARVPDWVRSAPPGTRMVLSARSSWLLEHRALQELVSRHPVAEQVLDLFLKKAGIVPSQESGRISFFLLGGALPDPARPMEASGAFLLQFGGFQDPRALQVAIAEAFPAEGSLRVAGRELPLYVVLDLNQMHIRVAVDQEGRAWVGDLKALAQLEHDLPRRDALAEASEWLPKGGSFAGVLRADEILKSSATRLPTELAREIPRGIDAVAWSLSPANPKDPYHRLDLVLTGSREGIQQALPWLQRLVALTSSVKAAGQQPPELFQEARRAGMRCALSPEQFETLAERLGQAGLQLSLPRKR